jgi:ribosomal protein L20A (L18A)
LIVDAVLKELKAGSHKEAKELVLQVLASRAGFEPESVGILSVYIKIRSFAI